MTARRAGAGRAESINRLVSLLGELRFARSGGNRTAKLESRTAIARSTRTR